MTSSSHPCCSSLEERDGRRSGVGRLGGSSQRAFEHLQGHDSHLGLVAARQDHGLLEQADLGRQLRQVRAGFGDPEVAHGGDIHAPRIQERSYVQRGGLYNSEVTVTTPSRYTETRHSESGKTCHHFARFKLTCDDYDRLRARAAGCCELCGIPEGETPRGALIIDHFQDRNDFYVRGLICDKCNAVMSCYDGNKVWGENRKWAGRAAAYAANSFQSPSQTPVPAVEPPPVVRRRTVRVPIGDPVALARALRNVLGADEIAALVAELGGPK